MRKFLTNPWVIAGGLIAAAVAFYLFRPDTLFLDDRADESLEDAFAAAAEPGGADAVTVANTMPGMSIDLSRMRPSLGNITGGLSGRALLPVNLAMVWKVSGRVSIPIVGCGGIATSGDALEYIAAGATAVQVGTAIFRDPGTPARIAQGLAEQLRSRCLTGIDQCVGLARRESKVWKTAAGRG